MPSNIEIKARVADFSSIQERAASISDTLVEVIPQEDTFFNLSRGRLKLRQLSPDAGQLVYYERPDQDGPKRSNYLLAATTDPHSMKTILSAVLGVRGIVRKTRYLYMCGNTRIHLDKVEGLGDFMELEVVLQEGQTDAEGQEIAEELMKQLGIRSSDLIQGAYMDLLEQK